MWCHRVLHYGVLLVEDVGLEPTRLESCKDSPGALPNPHVLLMYGISYEL